jgi:hypothetical protein
MLVSHLNPSCGNIIEPDIDLLSPASESLVLGTSTTARVVELSNKVIVPAATL